MLCGACAVGGMSPGSSGRAWRSVRLSACLTGGQQKAGRAARWLVGWSRGTSCIVGSGSVVCGCAAPGRLRSWRWWRMRGPPSFSRKAFDGADGGQRVNEEIARLAKLARGAGRPLPLFEGGTDDRA